MDVTKGLCQLSLSSDGDEENCDFDQVPCPGAWPSSPQLPPEPFVLAPSWYDPIEPDPSKPSDSEHALKLMQLPQEIRDMIFEYAFGITNIVENPILTKSSKLEPLPLARRYYRHELEGRGFLACLITVKLMPSVNLGSIIVSKQFFHDALSICHPRNGIGMFISENLDFGIHNSLPNRPSFLEIYTDKLTYEHTKSMASAEMRVCSHSHYAEANFQCCASTSATHHCRRGALAMDAAVLSLKVVPSGWQYYPAIVTG